MGKKSPIPVDERTGYNFVISSRREIVAKLMFRCRNYRAIAAEMANPESQFYFVNPRKDNEPFSESTIYKDTVYLQEQSVQSAQEDYEIYKSKHLAEIRQARMEYGWTKNDPDVIHKYLVLEMKLLGTLNGSVTNNFNQFNQTNTYIDKLLAMFTNEDGTPKTVNDMSDAELMLIASQGLPEVVEGEVVDDD